MGSMNLTSDYSEQFDDYYTDDEYGSGYQRGARSQGGYGEPAYREAAGFGEPAAYYANQPRGIVIFMPVSQLKNKMKNK